MTNEIMPFNFESHAIRVQVDESGETWFLANDVCLALEYSNPRDAVAKHVDVEDVAKRDTPTAGGIQQINHINESGLYALVFGSQLDAAKRFKRWVTSEVLPSIRKTGIYSTQSVPTKPDCAHILDATKLFIPFNDIALAIGCDKGAAAISANQAVLALSGTNILQLMGQTHIAAANQESIYYTPTELGKRIGTSARGMNLLLAESGFQMKRGEHWEVTDAGKDFARIYDTGKKHGTGVPVQQIKWSAEVIPAIGKDVIEVE